MPMNETMDDPGRRDLAPALTRGLKILDLVAASQRSLTMAQIGRELGLAKSSVHGLCATLSRAGFLERMADGTFRLGLRLVDLANARLEGLDLPAEFYARWDALNLFRQEAAVLAVRDGADVIYIACRNSTLALGVTFRIGMRLPACCTATGKAILSTLSDDEIRAFYNQHQLTTPTQASVRTVDALIDQIREIRLRGYSVDNGETRDHMYSLGAPVITRESRDAVAGVAVSFLKSDVTEEKTREAISVIRDFATALSRTQGSIQTQERQVDRSAK